MEGLGSYRLASDWAGSVWVTDWVTAATAAVPDSFIVTITTLITAMDVEFMAGVTVMEDVITESRIKIDS